VQVVLALVVTPEGFPLGYEVLPGNTLDKKTLNSWKGSSLYFSDRLFLPEYRLTGACVLLMSTTIIWCSSADPVAGMAWLQSTYTIRRETGKNRGLTLFSFFI